MLALQSRSEQSSSSPANRGTKTQSHLMPRERGYEMRHWVLHDLLSREYSSSLSFFGGTENAETIQISRWSNL